jgi:hypothetical protein
LDQIRIARPSVEIETVEVLSQPARVVRDRVFKIPALIVDGRRWFHTPPLIEILAVLDAE